MTGAMDPHPEGRMTSTGLVARAWRRAARIMHRRLATLRNARPIVTFTFDDVPRSACREGAQVMEQHGARGTFYVCGGLTGKPRERRAHSLEDLVAVARSGHEIGCHGFQHVDYQSIGIDRVRADLNRNQRFLEDAGLTTERMSFAYPFGCIDPRIKREIGRRYASARGVVGGSQVGTIDLNLLRATPLYSSRLDERSVAELIDGNADAGGWLIFFTHEVEPTPGTYGCTPDLLMQAVRRAVATGSEVRPVTEVLAMAVTPRERNRKTPDANTGA